MNTPLTAAATGCADGPVVSVSSGGGGWNEERSVGGRVEGSGDSSVNMGLGQETGLLPSPVSSPTLLSGGGAVAVRVRREDVDGECPFVVEALLSRGKRTIGDLKRALGHPSRLKPHEMVLLFAEHQLTDSIRLSNDDLAVVHQHGGITLRRRDQKCGSKRLFSKGHRSLATYIARNIAQPQALLQQQQQRYYTQQQQPKSQQVSPPPPANPSEPELDNDATSTTSTLSNSSEDDDELQLSVTEAEIVAAINNDEFGLDFLGGVPDSMFMDSVTEMGMVGLPKSIVSFAGCEDEDSISRPLQTQSGLDSTHHSAKKRSHATHDDLDDDLDAETVEIEVDIIDVENVSSDVDDDDDEFIRGGGLNACDTNAVFIDADSAHKYETLLANASRPSACGSDSLASSGVYGSTTQASRKRVRTF